MKPILTGAVLLALAACGPDMNRPLGESGMDRGFGNATMNNTLVQSGQRDATMALGRRFRAEVPSTITFAFNSAVIDANAAAVLTEQANWIRQFPEVRFRVYGHTDLVGSNAYNRALGLRRAKAVVSFLATRGISRSRLEALVSYGETRPVVATAGPEMRNRRTVTDVSGFVERHPTVLDGKYAAVIHRTYITLAERPHPQNVEIQTQTNPSGG